MSYNGTDTHPPIPIPRRGISGIPGILLFVLLCLAAASLPLCATYYTATPFISSAVTAGITMLIAFLLFIHLARACSSTRGFIPLLAITGVFLFFLTGSLVPFCLAVSLLFIIGEGSMLLAVMTKRQAVLFPLVLVGAYAVSLLITGSILLSLLCLLPFPAAWALGAATRSSAGSENGLTRVGVICLTSLAIGLSLIAALFVWLYAEFGSVDPRHLINLINDIRDGLISALVNIDLGELKELTAENTVIRAPTEEEAANMVNSVINILPGIVVIMVNILSAASQMILHAGLKTFGFGESVTDRVRVFRMSIVSAVAFLATYITALVTTGNTSSLAGTVAENVSMILMPGLALCGLMRLNMLIIRRTSRGGAGCLVFLLIAIPCLLFLAPSLLAIYESIAAVLTPLFAKLNPPNDSAP